RRGGRRDMPQEMLRRWYGRVNPCLRIRGCRSRQPAMLGPAGITPRSPVAEPMVHALQPNLPPATVDGADRPRPDGPIGNVHPRQGRPWPSLTPPADAEPPRTPALADGPDTRQGQDGSQDDRSERIGQQSHHDKTALLVGQLLVTPHESRGPLPACCPVHTKS